MTAPPEAGDDAPPVVDLSSDDIARLRSASGWARFIAVALFVGAAASAVTIVLAVRRYSLWVGPTTFIPLAVTFSSTIGAGALLWSYRRNIVSFIADDDLALVRAFRRLRHAVMLWTLLTAFGIVVNVLALARRL